MPLEDLANLGEFIGGIAVLGSLLYLALQIRQGNRQVEQNTRSLEASTHQAIIGDLNRFRALLVQDEALGALYLRGLEDPAGLDPAEQFRFRGLLQSLFSNLELQWKSRASGLYSLDSQDATVLGVALAPGARAWWQQARYLFDSDFQRYVEDLVARHDGGRLDAHVGRRQGPGPAA